jgi:hypothetical protein
MDLTNVERVVGRVREDEVEAADLQALPVFK